MSPRRSANRLVRNPVLGVPGIAELRESPARDDVVRVLQSIRRDAAERAEKSWRTHKAPMALYWKAVSVYAGHIARAIKGDFN